jgi:hypothetical protein
MNSGTISNNTASIFGGGVMFTDGGKFIMSGGIISNNTASATSGGGGVFAGDSILKLGGAAVIKNNTRAVIANNVHLYPDCYIEIGTGVGGNGVPVPATGMSVGVTKTDNNGVIVQSGASDAVRGYFFADDASKTVVHDNGQLLVKAADAASNAYDITLTLRINNAAAGSGHGITASTGYWDSDTEQYIEFYSTAVGSNIIKFEGLPPNEYYISLEMLLPTGGDIYIGSVLIEIEGNDVSKVLDFYTVEFDVVDNTPDTYSTIYANYDPDPYYSLFGSLWIPPLVLGGGTLTLTVDSEGTHMYDFEWTGTGIASGQTTNRIVINNLSAAVNVTCTVTGNNDNEVESITITTQPQLEYKTFTDFSWSDSYRLNLSALRADLILSSTGLVSDIPFSVLANYGVTPVRYSDGDPVIQWSNGIIYGHSSHHGLKLVLAAVSGVETETGPLVVKHRVAYHPSVLNAPPNTIVTHNESYTFPNYSETQIGYTFDGWEAWVWDDTTQSGGNRTFTVGQTINVRQNLAIYARWRAVGLSNNDITLTVQKDDSPWSGHPVTAAKAYRWDAAGDKIEVNGVVSGTTITFSNLPGDEQYLINLYNNQDLIGSVWVDVKNSNVNETADFYTVVFGVENAGNALGSTIRAYSWFGAGYDKEIQSGDVVFGDMGLTIVVDPEGAHMYTFAWTGTGIPSGQTTNRIEINPTSAVNATCTVTGNNDKQVTNIVIAQPPQLEYYTRNYYRQPLRLNLNDLKVNLALTTAETVNDVSYLDLARYGVKLTYFGGATPARHDDVIPVAYYDKNIVLTAYSGATAQTDTFTVIHSIWYLDYGKLHFVAPSADVTHGGSHTVASYSETRSGYTFDGWDGFGLMNGSETIHKAGETITVSQSLWMYARWRAVAGGNDDDQGGNNNRQGRSRNNQDDNSQGDINNATTSISQASPTESTVTKLPMMNTIAQAPTGAQAEAATDAVANAAAVGESNNVSIKAAGSPVAVFGGSSPSVTTVNGVETEGATVMAILNDDGTLTPVPTKINDDGTVTVLITGDVVLVPLNVEAGFEDMTEHWAESEVNRAAALMIVQGVGGGYFNPEGEVTGAEAVTMFLRALGMQIDGDAPAVGGINQGAWYAGAVNTAVASGLIGADIDFGQPMTRIQTAELIYSALETLDMKPGMTIEQAKEVLANFTDLGNLTDEQLIYMGVLVELGIFKGNGDDTMTPDGVLQRVHMFQELILV